MTTQLTYLKAALRKHASIQISDLCSLIISDISPHFNTKMKAFSKKVLGAENFLSEMIFFQTFHKGIDKAMEEMYNESANKNKSGW